MIPTKLFISFSFLFLVSLPGRAENVLKLSTTTSTENSGLLAVLNPVFEKQSDSRVDVIAVGTGKALKIGANGDVDVVFVHAPEAELKYVKTGDFIDRVAVMHNDFVIVGPKNDPADIVSANTISEVLTRIAKSKLPFISRGDDSGTHKKEKQLWKLVGTEPKGAWYKSAGQGMGAVLLIASNEQGYTLADRGTQIAFSEKIDLNVLFEGGEALFNPYHIMAVNPEKGSHIQYQLAKKYIAFIVSEKGQAIIANFKKNGQPLFYPDAKERARNNFAN